MSKTVLAYKVESMIKNPKLITYILEKEEQKITKVVLGNLSLTFALSFQELDP